MKSLVSSQLGAAVARLIATAFVTGCGGGGGGSAPTAASAPVAFTADDPIGGYTAYQRNAQGVITQEISYNGAGADGLWFTADDAQGTVLTILTP